MNFDAAFRILTTHAPLPWQTRLYSELAQGRIPSALDLPTGLGKTSVIAAWLAARAAGGALPRRLVYVVDRRAVVDQATEVAQAIAKALGDGTDANEAVSDLRAGLGLDVGKVLPVSTLRGQYADNRQWLESPTAPAIVVGTIDMIGSAFCFRATASRRACEPCMPLCSEPTPSWCLTKRILCRHSSTSYAPSQRGHVALESHRCDYSRYRQRAERREMHHSD